MLTKLLAGMIVATGLLIQGHGSAIQPTANVHIGATDVAGFNLVIPPQRQIPGRITLEGGGVIPRFTLPLTAPG